MGILFWYLCVSPSLHLPSPTCSVLGSAGTFVLETSSAWPWLSARCSPLHEAFVHDGSGETRANQAEGGGGEGEEPSLPLERNSCLFGGTLAGREVWQGLLPCPLPLVAQDQLCVGGGEDKAPGRSRCCRK